MRKIRIKFNSPVVLIFVLLCFVVTIMGMVTQGKTTQILFMTYHSSFSDLLTYVRFLTHVLGHADWGHFVGNIAYILLLGPMLEEKHGGTILVKIIILTAVSTGIVNYICFPSIALCGASGIVFAFILLTSFTSFREGEVPITVILVAFIFIGQQIYEGACSEDNVSNMSHIVGGIVGATVGYKLNRKSKYGF